VNWLLHLYPARWRERYGEEFRAVLASQRASLGLFFDVLGGAVDAHLHPQILHSHANQTEGDDTMTLAMLQRCAAGGAKLSPDDRRIASRVTTFSALAIAVLCIVLTKIYREAAPVQALIYAAAPALSMVYAQTAYLRRRSWRVQAFILGVALSGVYLFMLGVCLIAKRL
jgi:drug/metabolite transporter (DMT)-like permease